MPASESPLAPSFALPPRSRLPAAAVIVAWGVLAARLIQLQWSEQEDLAAGALRQSSAHDEVPARPGDIVDRHGRLLATSVATRSLYLVPSRIEDPWETARRLEEAIAVDADDLFRRLGGNRERHFLWVRRRLSDAEAERIADLGLPAGTWGFREEYLRRYPQGALAAHVLGLRDIDGVGRGGVEQSCDGALGGIPGRRTLRRDARGRVIDMYDEIADPPRPGRTVMLAIDAVVQMHAERELDRIVEERRPRSATAIVIGVPECEVLAMASRPAFDPNDPSRASPAAWEDTAIAAIYEPGSTFKPFVVGWAIQQKALDRNERFDCEHGAYRMGRRVLHDHHPYGVLDVTDILVKSSNVGMAKIGERLGNRELYRAAVAFGFGQPTGIELPGELAGILRPLAKWNGYSTGSVPMGQEIAATPLQVAVAHAALAAGGTLRTPRLVLAVGDGFPISGGSTAQFENRPHAVVSRALDAGVAEWLVGGPLREVVTRGTGRRAELDDVALFGKSGTAQKLDPATGRYSMRLHTSSFVCGGPVDAPRAVVLVVVDEPSQGDSQFGGAIAAAPAARILRQTLLAINRPPPRGAE